MSAAPTSPTACAASRSATRYIRISPAPTPAPRQPSESLRARTDLVHARGHARAARPVAHDRAGSDGAARPVGFGQVDDPATAEPAGRSGRGRRADERGGRARARRARTAPACRARAAAAGAAARVRTRERGLWAVVDRKDGGSRDAARAG